MEHTLIAVVSVMLGGVMVLIPVLFLVLLSGLSGSNWDRHPRAVVVLILLVAVLFALRSRYALYVLSIVGSVLLAYGVAALANASRAATLRALGIGLLCSILLWGGFYLVQVLRRLAQKRQAPPSETVR
jgi:hypothetical protein